MMELEHGVELTTLPNGLRIVSQQLPHMHSATLVVWVASGSRHESKHQHGISHLLEHMAFKSTLTRSTREMAESIEAVGGEINAATSQESTAYYAKVLAADTGLAFELLADMLLNPRFDADELAREIGVIVQEIAGANDQPEDLVFEQAEAAAFQGQSLGRAILGTRESVSAITSKNLFEHMQLNYTPGRIAIGAAGAVSHSALVRHAEALFGGSNRPESQNGEPARFTGGIRFVDEAFEQHHVLLAYEGPSYLHPRYEGAQLLTGILGGGASSRLFQKVREERGLCYGIDALGWGYSDSGIIGIQAAANSGAVGEIMTIVAAEIRDLAERGPSASELSRVKAQMRAGLLMSMESSAARAEQLVRQTMIHGAPQASAALVANIEAVSAANVRDLASDIFGSRKFVWSEVGPGADGQIASRFQRLIG